MMDVYWILSSNRKGIIKECSKFEYLGVKINKDFRQKNDVKFKVNEGRPAMLNGILWNKTKIKINL